MVNSSEYFGGSYLKVSDLRDTVRLTIKKAKEVEFDDGKKLALEFDEIDKLLILNKTNAERISAIAGDHETDKWPGTKVELIKAYATFRGQEVECIRVKRKDVLTTTLRCVACSVRPGNTWRRMDTKSTSRLIRVFKRICSACSIWSVSGRMAAMSYSCR